MIYYPFKTTVEDVELHVGLPQYAQKDTPVRYIAHYERSDRPTKFYPYLAKTGLIWPKSIPNKEQDGVHIWIDDKKSLLELLPNIHESEKDQFKAVINSHKPKIKK